MASRPDQKYRTSCRLARENRSSLVLQKDFPDAASGSPSSFCVRSLDHHPRGREGERRQSSALDRLIRFLVTRRRRPRNTRSRSAVLTPDGRRRLTPTPRLIPGRPATERNVGDDHLFRGSHLRDSHRDRRARPQQWPAHPPEVSIAVACRSATRYVEARTSTPSPRLLRAEPTGSRDDLILDGLDRIRHRS